MKFLILDDEKDHIELIKRIIRLEFKESVIHSASNFVDFKKLLAMHKYSFITMDIMMPDINGITALKEVRNSENNHNTLVMIISANIEQATKINAFKLGADEYISKPFDMEELILRIKNLINLSKLSETIKKKDQLLLDSENYFYDLFKLFPYPTLFLDMDLNIIDLNNEGINLFGDLRGDFRKLFISNDHIFSNSFSDNLKIKKWIINKNLIYKNKKTNKFYLFTATFHFSKRENTDERILVWLFDRTEENLLKSQHIQNEKNSLLCKLSDSLTHELNNLITGMAGYAELGKMRKNDPEFIDKALNIVLQNCFKVSEMIDSLRQLSIVSKNDSNEIAINHSQLFSNILLLNSYYLNKKKINLYKDFKAKSPIIILPSELQQIFFLLLENSINSINHTNGKIYIKTWDEDDSWCIQIEDNGCGVPESEIDRIFDPFFSDNPEEKSELGLYVVRQLLSKYGSSIEYSKNYPQGNIVKVTISTNKN